MNTMTIRGTVTILTAGVLLSGFSASSAAAGSTAAELKARAQALLPAQSPTSAEMSTQAVALPLDEFALTTELPSVHFDFASATIRPDEKRILDANVAWMKANPGQFIAIEGAADPRGNRDYNLALGQRRARAVRDYLVARGVAPERISILSTGRERQACRGRDCWALDRRVDFLAKRLTRQAP